MVLANLVTCNGVVADVPLEKDVMLVKDVASIL